MGDHVTVKYYDYIGYKEDAGTVIHLVIEDDTTDDINEVCVLFDEAEAGETYNYWFVTAEVTIDRKAI